MTAAKDDPGGIPPGSSRHFIDSSHSGARFVLVCGYQTRETSAVPEFTGGG
ncbi:MAG TPA: hypothetical protein VMV92_24770 [Streptosporangiaceae bacterium]|nr:hypothetical protein [Streptosporangiaceae bacterium]